MERERKPFAIVSLAHSSTHLSFHYETLQLSSTIIMCWYIREAAGFSLSIVEEPFLI